MIFGFSSFLFIMYCLFIYVLSTKNKNRAVNLTQ